MVPLMRNLSLLLAAAQSACSLWTPAQYSLSDTDHADKSSISKDLYNTLVNYAQLVDIAYCVSTTGITQPFECLSWCTAFPHCELIEAFNTGALLDDAAGYVALDHSKTDSKIVIAFRGTYNIGNTITDLSTMPQKYVPYVPPENDDAPKTDCANCTVHAGFLASWKNIRDAIVGHVEAAKEAHPTYPVHLIGHSLGGAMSLLAGLDFHARGWEPSIVTFGEPRVGNAEFVALVNSMDWTYMRVTHEDDPVPLLPPSRFGYRSHGSELYIKQKDLPVEAGDVISCDGNEDEKCSAKGDLTRLWELFFSHRDYFIRMGLCTKKDGSGSWDGWFDGGDSVEL